jgi:type IV fimbrial biogenesis protein FimT
MTTTRGFSLIELMITLAVLAIVLAAAAPSFSEMLQRTRAATQANELLSAFSFARSEALKRARPVSVCSSADGLVCGGQWSDGWLVFVDGSIAGSATASVAQVLRVWPGPEGGASLQARQTINAGGDTAAFTGFVRMLPSGAVDPAAATGRLTFQMRSPEPCLETAARDLILSPVGRAAVVDGACS